MYKRQLHALTPVTGLLHIGLALHFSCPDAADHDVDLDVTRMVEMCIRDSYYTADGVYVLPVNVAL